MPLKPVKGVGIRTDRDIARQEEREALALEWARVDRDIAEALDHPLLSRQDPKE